MTDRAWFSRLVRHPARKRHGSILTTPEPARGDYEMTKTLTLITIRAPAGATLTMTTQNVVKNPLPSLSRHFISFSPFYIIIYSLLQVVQKHKLGKVGSETIILNQYTSAAAEVQWLRQPI